MTKSLSSETLRVMERSSWRHVGRWSSGQRRLRRRLRPRCGEIDDGLKGAVRDWSSNRVTGSVGAVWPPVMCIDQIVDADDFEVDVAGARRE